MRGADPSMRADSSRMTRATLRRASAGQRSASLHSIGHPFIEPGAGSGGEAVPRGAKLDPGRTKNPRPFVQFRAAAGLLFATIALILLAGCGSESNHLAVQDSATVAGFQLDVARTVVDGSGYGDLLESVDEVIAIARDDPQAVYQPEPRDHALTMRQVLSDAAADLSPYQPDLAAKLDRAVQTLD